MNEHEIGLLIDGLSFEIRALIETSYKKENTLIIKNKLLDFCLKNHISLDYLLSRLNHCLPSEMQIEKDYITDSSYDEHQSIINTTVFPIVNQYGVLGNKENTENIISEYCSLTECNDEFVRTLINVETKKSQKDLIETVLYKSVKRISESTDKEKFEEFLQEAIQEFSKDIGAKPEYTAHVLKEKFKEEQEEIK